MLFIRIYVATDNIIRQPFLAYDKTKNIIDTENYNTII